MSFQMPERNTLMPYLAVRNAASLLAFVKAAFNAEVLRPPLMHQDGTLWNAECRIGDSCFMIAEACGMEPLAAFLHLYVEDCDATFARAVELGATPFQEPSDHFYGDRAAGVRDEAGNIWWIATHQETISAEEMARRAAAHQAGTGDG